MFPVGPRVTIGLPAKWAPVPCFRGRIRPTGFNIINSYTSEEQLDCGANRFNLRQSDFNYYRVVKGRVGSADCKLPGAVLKAIVTA